MRKVKKLTKAQHKKRHVMLHQCLDELAADYMRHTGFLVSNTSVMQLMEWSCLQMQNPTEHKED